MRRLVKDERGCPYGQLYTGSTLTSSKSGSCIITIGAPLDIPWTSPDWSPVSWGNPEGLLTVRASTYSLWGRLSRGLSGSCQLLTRHASLRLTLWVTTSRSSFSFLCRGDTKEEEWTWRGQDPTATNAPHSTSQTIKCHRRKIGLVFIFYTEADCPWRWSVCLGEGRWEL